MVFLPIFFVQLKIKMKSIRIKSPATVANLVCGFDILGMALQEPCDIMELKLLDDPVIRITNKDEFGLPEEPDKNVAGVVLQSIMEKLDTKHGFELIAEKHIMPGSGIGSSAASAAGAAFAANHLLGNIFSQEDLVQFAMNGEKLASARIRKGEIDREGRRLRGTNEPPRELPKNGRTILKAPKGDLFAAKDGIPEKRVVDRIQQEQSKCVIAVGDVTTSTILKQNYTPQVMIVDGITKRGRFEERLSADRVYTIYNPPAMIYPESWSVIDTAIHNDGTSLIDVEGEEDLMGFPAVLLAPDGSVVLYGQPDVGIVWIPVNRENKKIARLLLEQMPVITS